MGEVVTMHGGVVLFRGTGADAMRYVEADRSRADDYYLGDATGIGYTVLDASGEATSTGAAAAYAALTSGAYAPAAGERVVVIVCGANTDPATLDSPVADLLA